MNQLTLSVTSECSQTTDFSIRNQSNGNIHFGMARTKKTKVILCWVQYFYPISVDPTIINMNEVMFIRQLETSLYRSDIRNIIIDQFNTNTKEASTGPLESEKKWKEWESKFIKYLSKLIGFNVVLLSNMV